MRLLPPVLMLALLSACATTNVAERDPRDPYEGFNRGVFAFNQAADQVVIKPVTQVYRAVTPKPARRGISRVFANLMEPLNFVNNLLQGKPKRAFNSLGRFLVNTTIGVGGLADHATDLGLPPTREDYGQTLAVAGARKSPYLVLPILGPSTVRDAVGSVLTFATDPTQIIMNEANAGFTEQAAIAGLRVVDGRSQAIDAGFDTLLKTSADPYAAARDAYLQSREAQIADEDVVNASGTLAPDQQQELLDKALEEDAVTPAPSSTATPPATVTPTDPQEGASEDGPLASLDAAVPGSFLAEDGVTQPTYGAPTRLAMN